MTDPRVEVSGEAAAYSPTTRGRVIEALLHTPTGLAGTVVVAIVVVLAVLAPVIAPDDPNHIDLAHRLRPPALWTGGGSGSLGTDRLGKDVLNLIIHGARLSLLIGSLAVVLSALVGVTLGLLAGYLGGKLDAMIMRAADVQLAFPFILLAIAIVGVLGPTVPNIVLVLALSGWVQFVRVVRAETLSLRQRPFIEATRIIGASSGRILRYHLLPNVLPSVIVLATLELGRVIILESGLAFLGLGIPPPAITWGAMLAEGRDYVREAWWLSVFPGLALLILVLAINLAGDALRNALDPTLAE
jgi:peptide/nickel transport system permease protein